MLGDGVIKTLVFWHWCCITLASSVFNQARRPHSTRYCNFAFTLSPEVIVLFLYSKPDFYVYLAAFTCMMTKSDLGGYLMDDGNVVCALET